MKRNLYWIVPGFLTLLVPVIFYWVYGHELILKAYLGEAPDWFNYLVETFYPRFFAEKNRLEISFFEAKADQVVLRYLVLLIFAAVVYAFEKYTGKVKVKISNLSEKATSVQSVYFLRVLFYLLLIIATRDVYEDLRALNFLEVFYRPLLFLKVLHLPFPGKKVAFLIYGTLFLSSILVIFGLKPVLFSVMAMVSFVVYQAYLFSFEKIDHGYGPFTYACMLFPFLLWERTKAKKEGKNFFSSWSLKLILIVTCLVYFMSGMEKILISGIEWLSPLSFKSYLALHDTSAGRFVAENEFLVNVLPALALLLQLSFPLILFFDRLKYVILPAGVLFHFGTVLLFGISSFENPWVFNYIFFFDWTKPGEKLAILPQYFRS